MDSAVVITVTGHSALLVAGMEYMLEQIADASPLKDLRLVRAVDPNAVAASGREVSSTRAVHEPRDFSGETLVILEENGIPETDVGVVGIDTMPMPFYESLFEGLGRKFKRVPDVVAKLRSIKSPAEIEAMRSAARLSDLGFETMLRVAKPGMRGIEIIAKMERVVRQQGADHAKYWMASGPPTDWKDTRLDLKPHERILQEGDLMAACSYVLYKGYWSHGQRTGTIGKPSKKLEEIYAIAKEAQDAGLAILKAGTAIAQVGKIIAKSAAKHGFKLAGGRIGHGIGMDYSELPVPLNDRNEDVLQSGMTVELHAIWTLPETGKMFVPLGDVCHITDGQPELLMKFPRTPFLAGQ